MTKSSAPTTQFMTAPVDANRAVPTAMCDVRHSSSCRISSREYKRSGHSDVRRACLQPVPRFVALVLRLELLVF
eukprot:CAMPEP_0180045570 /NCGR_PEP_ID=MMETSP0984-20121128/36559_1 /TAXON_ID=483367 /ORGANISM="non described non described, Strain CCMP 2436" /LENGTH=73 /DNA_ID=CAMNT_0021973877 /DNA_START=57 /DNA_END=275 /DNA_ORIENTATION=+